MKRPPNNLFGLIGHPLDHSYSQQWFREKFAREGIEAGYQNFDLDDIAQLPALLQKYPALGGLNVTVPYKEQVIPFLSELDETARTIGSVNTIKIQDGRLIGHNTDYTGFMVSIEPLLLPFDQKALILGTGGASKAVMYGLQLFGLECKVVSRYPLAGQLAYSDLDAAHFEFYSVIINTTPVGMYPKVDEAPPIPYEYLHSDYLLFDLIYNPEETLFLKRGRERGARVKNGLEMLQIQAEESWKVWTS